MICRLKYASSGKRLFFSSFLLSNSFSGALTSPILLLRLQGSCLKGDYCEFSHNIDVQEVASKIHIQTPTKKEPIRFDEHEYPGLQSRYTPSSSFTTQSPPPPASEEFPSLASAAATKKQPAAAKPAFNFAEIAKRKGPPQDSRKSDSKKKTQTDWQIMERLRRPVRIPWLETGNALNSNYLKQVRAKNKESSVPLFFSFVYLIYKRVNRRVTSFSW